jgi:hypothetical protein
VTCVACGSASTTTSPSPLVRVDTITFGELSNLSCPGLFPISSSCAVSSYQESGFTVSVLSGNWSVRTDYGNPAPFIEFAAEAGTTVTGEIRVTASGAPFRFASVDLYSSTTAIPYQITGLRNSTSVFVLADTAPQTFGNFRVVGNPNAAAVIDALSIVLTNPAAPCCRNPTGLDNITLRP